MKQLKRLWHLLPALVLWLMLSVFLWGWVFTRLTDTGPENKLSLFVDAPLANPTALAVQLEEALVSEDIRMVKVHPFSYAMLDGEQLRCADAYIVRESHLAEYREWFAPLPEGLSGTLPAARLWQPEGVPMGILVYDAETGQGLLREAITYREPALPGENFYLLLGAGSLHLTGNPGSVDDAATELALYLLQLP